MFVRLSSILFLFFTICMNSVANEFIVASPDNRLQLKIQSGEQLSYQILLDNEAISDVCAIGMSVRGKSTIGENAEVISVERNSVNTTIPVVFGENDELEDHYNEMTLIMDDYNLICRAYDEGVAYCFETKYRGGIIVEKELVEFVFPQTPVIHLAYEEPPRTMSHWELPYSKLSSVNKIPVNDYAINPLMFKNEETGLGITVIESDLEDYPGMYILRPDNSGRLVGKFAEYPDQIEGNSMYDSQKVLTRRDYIANTKGTRKFPWRGFIITHDDKDLLNNELIYKLAKPQELDDISWLTAGKTAWEWLHDGELEGVDFPAGPDAPRSLELYKYYVDFAAENGLEYMTLDAGWNNSYIEELCQYAAEKNVKIFVWNFFGLAIGDPSQFKRFRDWGIAGIKVDFIARDDQIATGWLTTMARRCAEQQLAIIMHGSPKPTGLHRTYPNILNYEGVVGEEHNKWNNQCSPQYRTTFPFLRLLGGPADITPGSLRNKTKLGFRVKGTGAPNSLGTRTQQMAMYVICHHPLGFVSDAPTEYRKFPQVTEFISKIPVVWNETKPLKAEIGEYLVIARRTGMDWYVGGITNWTERKEMEIDFSFLEEGVSYRAQIMKDDVERNNDSGFRAGDATACIFETLNIDKNTVLKVDMAQGGGIVIHLVAETNGNSLEVNKCLPMEVGYDKDSRLIRVETGGDPLQVILTDVLGRVIDSRESTGSLIIQAANLPNGAYILTGVGRNTRKSIKISVY